MAMAGNFSATASLAVIIISLARLSNKATVGQFSYALSICTPIFLLAYLRIRDIKSTETQSQYSTNDFFRVVLLTNSIGLVAIVPICLLAGIDRPTILIAIMIGVWRMVMAFVEVIYGVHQKRTDMKTQARLQIGHSVVTAIAFVASYFATRNIPIALGIVAASNLILIFTVDLKTIPREPADSNHQSESNSDTANNNIFRFILSVLPLGIGGAIFSLNMVFPRVLLEEHFSYETVGVFAALAFFARFGTPAMQAIGQTVSAKLSKSFQSGDRTNFHKLMMQATILPLAVGIALIIAGLLVGQQVLLFVFGPEFVVGKIDVVLIMVYATLTYLSTVLTFSLIASRRLTSQMLILTGTVLTTLVAGLILIPEYGITGACWSLTFSSIVRIIGTVSVHWVTAKDMSNNLATGFSRDITETS